MSEGFSSEQLHQLEAIVEAGVRKGFADAGLRISDGASEDEARRDFAFVRNLRKGVDGTAAKIGWMVIAAVIGAVIWLINSGLTFWRGQ